MEFKLFLTHPEVNPLAVAKRLGINPGLMTHYINGTRKPSKDCESKIYNEIKVIGESLAAIGSYGTKNDAITKLDIASLS